MLDYRFIKENLDAVKQNIINRNMDPKKADAEQVVRLFDERTALTTKLQLLRERRNANAALTKKCTNPEERRKYIEEGKTIKEGISEAQENLTDVESRLEQAARAIPNMANPEAPVGRSDSFNLEVKRVGTPREFDFKPKSHIELGESCDLLDFERGTKVSGVKFYYLKNEAVFLELALIMYALNMLKKHGFMTFITPDIAKEEILNGIGFNPRGPESNVYTIEDEGTCLIATAEITLGGYHSGEILDKASLPLMYAGVSHCFRREAGAAGQFSRGLYRVHQFDKVEMFVYCLPEQSNSMHEKLRLIEEEIFSALGLPFRVVDTCTGDLGASAYRKWDLEAWMPGRADEAHPKGDWGEVTSTSNCTDYQARRLNVKYRDDDGKNRYVHTLNGTAIAAGRAMLAIMENYQNCDGSITIPEVLVPYCGFDRIEPKTKR